MLTELLATSAFDLSVARGSGLARYLPGTSPAALSAAFGPTQVTTTSAGPQLLQINYLGPTPEVAKATLGLLVKQLQKDSGGFSAQHDEAAVSYYRKQVVASTQGLNATRQQVNDYLSHHNGSTANDPNLTVLTAAESAASTQLATANTNLAQANQSRSGGGWSVQVVDAPSTPVTATKSKKKMLEVIFAGLFAGALVSFLGAIALTPGKPREAWEDEISTGGRPPIPTATGPVHAGAASADVQAAFAAQRRFIVPRPSDEFIQP